MQQEESPTKQSSNVVRKQSFGRARKQSMDATPKLSSIFKKLGISNPVLEYRTPFEKSPYPCIENIVRGALKSFVASFGIKATLSLVLTLIKYQKWIKNPSILLKAVFNKDNAMLGCFIGSFTFIMKFTIFLARVIRKKDDGLNGFLGGFFAGYFSLFFSNKQMKTFLACMFLARAFDCYYNHLANKGTIKKSPYHYVWIFAVLNAVTGYAYGHEQYLLNPAMVKFGDRVTNQSRNEYILQRLYHEMTRRSLFNSGAITDLWFQAKDRL